MNKTTYKCLRLSSLFILAVCISVMFTACNPASHGYTATLTTVYTPKGTAVVGAHISELTSSDYNELNKQTTENFPNAIKKREPTNNYNCHSYAWHSQSVDNTVWIGFEYEGQSYIDEKKKYWTDGSYVKIASGSNNTVPFGTPNGSKVYYGDVADHSAIKTSDTKFTSKWGPAGLFEHSPSYCPYDSTNLDYYIYYKK